MDSLHTIPPITQFRCRPFTAGGAAPFDYRPAVEREQLETAWRQFNEQGAAAWMKIVSLWIAAIAISTGWPCMSLDGSPENAVSFSCVTDTSMSARNRLSDSRPSSRGCHEY